MGPTSSSSTPFFLFFLFIPHLLHLSSADLGTAAQYGPPYLPTACYGSETSQFPSSGMFAAAGDGVWDNGAACGRQYMVRCISASRAGTCKRDRVLVRIVDYALTSQSPPSASGATIVLSEAAFAAIADPSASIINIEFQQL